MNESSTTHDWKKIKILSDGLELYQCVRCLRRGRWRPGLLQPLEGAGPELPSDACHPAARLEDLLSKDDAERVQTMWWIFGRLTAIGCRIGPLRQGEISITVPADKEEEVRAIFQTKRDHA